MWAARGTVVLAGDAGVDPATVGFVLSRQLPDTDLWKPFLGAFVAAMVTEAALFAYLSRRRPKRLGWFKAEVAVGPTWSFKDSWLTNVAAVGALLGTILGAGDFLKDLIPGTSTVRLTAVSIIAGGMVTLAPVVYAAFSKWKSTDDGHGGTRLDAVGRGSGLWAAAGATVGGVFLELATIGYIADLSDASRGVKGFVYALLVIGALVVALYAILFTDGVVNGAREPAEGAAPTYTPVKIASAGL